MPLRLLCAAYGADAVYSEEIIDFKIVDCTRIVHEGSDLVEFVWNRDGKTKVFRTCPLEKEKLVFQVGSADAVRVVKAATLVERDVSGFDINMGCPQSFSLQGGMGAALLKTPEIAEDMLKSLRRNITSGVNITCKIRLLEDERSSVELVRRLEACSAEAIGVHMRETHHRPRDPAQWERLAALVDAVGVPIIANGDIYTEKDAQKVAKMSGCHGVMFARGALKNASVFRRKDELLPIYDIMRNCVQLSAKLDLPKAHLSWLLNQILKYNGNRVDRDLPFIKATKNSKSTMETFLSAFNLSETTAPICYADEELSWASLALEVPDEDLKRRTPFGLDSSRPMKASRSQSHDPSWGFSTLESTNV